MAAQLGASKISKPFWGGRQVRDCRLAAQTQAARVLATTKLGLRGFRKYSSKFSVVNKLLRGQ